MREKIKNAFSSISTKERLKSSQQNHLARLGELLRELAEIKKLASGLKAEERAENSARVQEHKRRLFVRAITEMMFTFLSDEEERETASFYQNGGQKTRALAAMGLFHRHRYETVKKELLWGGRLSNYQEVLAQLEEGLNFMDAAIKSLEFKSSIEKAYPRRKGTAKKWTSFSIAWQKRQAKR